MTERTYHLFQFALDFALTQVPWFLLLLLAVVILVSWRRRLLMIQSVLLSVVGMLSLGAVMVLAEVGASRWAWIQAPGGSHALGEVRLLFVSLMTLWGYWVIGYVWVSRLVARDTGDGDLGAYALRTARWSLAVGGALVAARLLVRAYAGPTPSGGNWAGALIYQWNQFVQGDIPNTLSLAVVLSVLWAGLLLGKRHVERSVAYSRIAYGSLMGAVFILSFGATTLDYGGLSSSLWILLHHAKSAVLAGGG